jgi:translation initiation factor 3 subunit H
MSGFNEVFSADPTIKPLREVHIDGLAVLQIIKHCNDNLPTLVSGSLLGVDVNGILEVTYAYPFPVPKGNEETGYDGSDGVEYQKEMMIRLREMNIDDNCVGWYQSTYLGTMCSNDVVGYQYSFQTSEDLSENTAVIMYDPLQASTDGNKLAIRAFRLTDKFIQMRSQRINRFIDPAEILQELPVRIKNSGHVSAFTRCLRDSHANVLTTPFEALSMANSSNYVDRNLELVNSWLEDLTAENQKFATYARTASKVRSEHIKWVKSRVAENEQRQQDGEDLLSLDVTRYHDKQLPESQDSRTEPLLMIAQLDQYTEQITRHIETSVQKIAITSKLN